MSFAPRARVGAYATRSTPATSATAGRGEDRQTTGEHRKTERNRLQAESHGSPSERTGWLPAVQVAAAPRKGSGNVRRGKSGPVRNAGARDAFAVKNPAWHTLTTRAARSGRPATFPPEVLSLFDKYVHNVIDRRGFLEGAAKFAVGGLTAAALLDALSPRFAEAQQVAKTDPRLKAEYVEFPSPQGYGKVRGYLVMPAQRTGQGRGASCRRSWSCTRTAASTRTSKTSRGAWRSRASWPSRPTRSFRWAAIPGDEDKGRELFAKLDQTKTREDFVAAAGFAARAPAQQRPARRRRLLLRRRHRQLSGHAPAGPERRRPLLRQRAAARQGRRRSRRRCCCTSPRTTNASTPPGPPTKRR